jgi:very-short-patch-repair endonuclease
MPEPLDFRSRLDRDRRELLDLSARNRLLNTPRGRARSSRLEIVDASSAGVFQRLVVERKPMGFQHTLDDEYSDNDDDVHLSQPEDEELSDENADAPRSDRVLRVPHTSEQLQTKLLKLAYDTRTYEEEQGVNILYLALGFLKWFEDEKSQVERFAPLLLVPVELQRQSATSRFQLRYTEGEIATNLSLQVRLEHDFGIKLPDVPDIEDLHPDEYFEHVQQAIADREHWEVLPDDIVLWFFSFSKFLMYRDLDPANWPEDQSLVHHPLIRGIMSEGFSADPPLCGEDDPIDALIQPLDMVHVLDADSSQAVVIEEVKRGRNLVIQGPPGTGKSQTIVNLIAAAVKAGKTVLFVAEKMAALEVVHRRLASIGLEAMCLELHSHKANKRAVLVDLAQTLAMNRPRVKKVLPHCEDLQTCRDALNAHLQRLHTPLQPCGLTPYQLVGELVRLRAAGTRAPQFQLAGALEWTKAQFEERLNLLGDLVCHVEQLRVPQQHPWRGVELEVVLPTDVDRIMDRVDQLQGRLQRLSQAGEELARLLGLPAPQTLREISQLACLAQKLRAAPPMDCQALSGAAWQQRREAIDELLHAGQRLAALRQKLAGVVVDSAWEVDVAAARRDLAAHGRSWLRFFHRRYREAVATLRGILRQPPPRRYEDRLALLDDVIHAQRTIRLLREGDELGRQAFGKHWAGPNSDWDALWAISRWESDCRREGILPDIRATLAHCGDVPDCGPLLKRIAADLRPAAAELQQLVEALRLNVCAAFGVKDLLSVPCSHLAARFAEWREHRESLALWVRYHVRQRRLATEGLADLVEQIHSGALPAAEAVARFEMAYYEQCLRAAFEALPELARFNGSSHEQLRERFRQLDKQRIELARYEVALAHYQRVAAMDASFGEARVLFREIEKKRRHLPIRQLLAKAGRAVQAIKPVFMMSPISVAQYLEPGAIRFDLLLIDEASQVQPVDALGAIARARQIVVVGDSKQLPPTPFFQRMLSENGADREHDDEFHAGDIESILGLCCARGLPQRMLRWHYRSRHHSLIAVSNREFYDNRLYVVPSPSKPHSGQGLVFRHVPHGTFDRGSSATNRVEAKVVAQAVMDHARSCPEKSLGVGTFSVSQRDAILDELELLRRRDPSLEHFFSPNKDEPFFVKNLENIQGDERDVVFISVGYAKDGHGYLSMFFGPVSHDGGERRLNVLITRARECCTVFSSITAEDIDLHRATSRGARVLQLFLKYARSGLLDIGGSMGEHQSEFELQVAEALRQHGYQTHPQVGVAGFFIDLAVVDPDQPGRYLLGIECDGANYHRARWARDRDRLRQAVLEDRGWILHRIWSTDWFHHPEHELRRLLEAIEDAKIQWAARAEAADDPPDVVPMRSGPIVRQHNDGPTMAVNTRLTAEPYKVASFRVTIDREIHELSPDELARIVGRIIDVEGPIHRDEIARRVGRLCGLQRTGSRIRAAVDDALDSLTIRAKYLCDGPFFSPRTRIEVPIRDRSHVDSPTLRRPEMLPPAEIRRALAAIVQAHQGVARDEAVLEASRLLGFKATSSQLRYVIEQQLQSLLDCKMFEQRGDRLYASRNLASADAP